MSSSLRTVSGLVKMKGSYGDNGIFVTDNCSFSGDISDQIFVFPRVVTIKGKTKQRVPVTCRICCVTAKPVIIKPSFLLCEINVVKDGRHGFDFESQSRISRSLTSNTI